MEKLQVVALVVAVAVLATNARAKDSRDNGDDYELPDVSEEGGDSGEICKIPSGIFPDPSSCQNYYRCSGGIAYIMECPFNTHFSPIYKVCMDPYKAGCVLFSTTKPTPSPTRPPSPTVPTTPPQTRPSPPTQTVPTTHPPPPTPTVPTTHPQTRPPPPTPTVPTTHPQTRPPTTPSVPATGPPTNFTSPRPTAPSFVCPSSQGLFPNPNDCYSFYHCDHDIPYLKYCPAKLHFNPILLVCDWPENAGCTPGATVAPPQPDPTDKPTTDEDCACACCIKPDPNDCRKYFRCYNGQAYHSSCSGGLVFNPEIQNCDYRKNVECRDNENPDVKPQPGFKCPSSEGMFPNPNDCQSFFHCDRGTAYLKECPANLHFNPVLLVCDWPKNAGCKPGATVAPPPEPTGTPIPDIDCHCECCILPNPNDCSSFYRCQSGKVHVQYCSDGLLFNPEINSCDFQSHVKCLPPTVVPPTGFQCPTPVGLFPNPVDCGSFFHCSHNTAYFKRCPPGLHFNPDLLVCDWPQNAGCIDSSSEVTSRPPLAVNGTCPCTCCLLPDKNDCHGFFRCRHKQLERFTCGSKLSFNPHTRNCEPSDSFKCSNDNPSKFQCPDGDGTFSHESDCSKYYDCNHDTAYLKHCPPGLHFSPNRKVCDWPKAAGCKGHEELGICSEGDGLYPNPADCATFYSCSNGKPYLMHCPANLHFSADRDICDWPEKAGCEDTGDNNHLPGTSPAPPPVTDPGKRGVFRCPQPNGLFPYPSQCSRFYHCANGIPYKKSCPEGLHFDPKLLVCNWPNQAGCKSGKPSSTPKPGSFKCPKSNGLFPNPVNCHSFYHCSNNNAFLKVCPAKLHFNPLLLVCDWPEQAGCGDAPPTSVDVVGPGEEAEKTKVKCPDKTCVCRIPDPDDCAAFYACQDGKPYSRRCPLGLHYNVNTEMCDLPKNAKCS